MSRPDAGRLREALGEMLRERHGRLAGELARTRRAAAAERVHQSRVAARSLRSVAGTLDAALDPALAARIEEDLRAVGKALGATREADVRKAWLTELARDAGLPAGLRRRLGAALERDCVAARRALRSHARSPAFARVGERLATAFADPRLVTHREDLRPWLVRRLRRRWKRLLRDLEADDMEPEALHALRLRGKHARYASEALLPLLGADPAPVVKPLKKLQSCLGDHHDGHDALAWIESRPEPLRRALDDRLHGPIRRRMKTRLRQYRRLRRQLGMPKVLDSLRKPAAGRASR